MDYATAGRQLTFAKQTPFRNVFKENVDKEIPPTLSDEAIALVFVAAGQKYTENDKIAEALTSVSPQASKHFVELQMMKTARGRFFTRFALFTKNPIDGLLVGFGTDEMYYVVTTWDGAGCDFWKPQFDLHRRPVLVNGEMKTVICLSHHGEVEVKLIPFGDGHIALCPKCNRLAYSGE